MAKIERSQHVPFEGEKHYTTSVFLISDELEPRVLLIHHRKLGVWMPPGGHEEELENPVENGIREVREETGIDITPCFPKPHKLDERAMVLPSPQYFLEEFIEAHGDQPAHFHLDLTYVVKTPHQDPVLQDAEHQAIRWFTKLELESIPLFSNVREIIKSIL